MSAGIAERHLCDRMPGARTLGIVLMLLTGFVAGFAVAPTASAHACSGGGCGGNDCGHDIVMHLHHGQEGICLSFPTAQN